MARPKAFDPDAALGAALELFWERGYDATSTADLVERLGIGRASLYATFASKHELYLCALERYLRIRDPDLVRMLSQPGPVLPAVAALIRRYAEECTGPAAARGCLVVNTAVERPGDAESAVLVQRSWAGLETALASALIRAQALGEIAAGRDPRALAAMVLAQLQGLRVLGKGRSDPRVIRAAAEETIAALAR